MKCLNCALANVQTTAVAVCVSCGAALCLKHSVIEERWLTRPAVMLREEPVEPPARIVQCATCATAHAAQHQPPAKPLFPSDKRGFPNVFGRNRRK
jgi:hypothetical protein